MSSDILANLNPEQHRAVTAPEESVLILAGAGSGKTRVLTTRIAWLLEHNLATTGEILAVTFTNKAAKEMLTRLEGMIPYDLRRMWVGTFHGLCNRILRIHAQEAGLPKTFQILDSGDQLSLVKRLMKAANIDVEKTDPKQVVNFINWCKENGLRSSGVSAKDASDLRLGLYQAYERECQKQGVVDFAELLLRCYELLTRNDLFRAHYQKRFRHILVDEFQDTNVLQYRWLKILAGEKLGPNGTSLNAVFAVGDDDQSIYAFRGANIGNMADFLKDFHVEKPIKLEQNYRSTKTVLDAANALIANNDGRLGKNLWTSGSQGAKILVKELESEMDEAAWVVDSIRRAQRLTGGDASWRQFAILYRTNAQSRALEAELTARGVPYRIYGGLRFFERAEVKNLLGYLRMITNPWDDTSFLRVVNFPTRGIGAKTIETLQESARASGQSLWATLIQMGDQLSGRLAAFRDLIFTLRETAQNMTLPDAVAHVIKASGLEACYEKDKDGPDRLENMKEVITAAEGWFKNERLPEDLLAFSPANDEVPTPMEGFLTQATLEAGDKSEGQNVNAVQLMTVHSAKGLEFPWVFIVGAEEGIFPHFSAVKTVSEGGQGGLEEERRLMYVAITRAKERLVFTHSKVRRTYGTIFNNPLSSFVKEIPAELVQMEPLFDDDEDDDSDRQGGHFYGRDRDDSYGRGARWGGSSSGYSGGYGRSGQGYSGYSSGRSSGSSYGSNRVSDAVVSESGRRSFAGAGASLAAAQQRRAEDDCGYKPGDRVRHDVFGAGTVKAVIGSGSTTVLRITFGSSTKDLLLRVAKEKLHHAG